MAGLLWTAAGLAAALLLARRPPNPRLALLLTAVPPAGVALAVAFC